MVKKEEVVETPVAVEEEVVENMVLEEKGAEKVVVSIQDSKRAFQAAKQADIARKTSEMIATAKKNSTAVLNAFRVEKRGNDAVLFERVILSPKLAGREGVKEFVSPNGKTTYYVERQVKKYSDNVVTE